MSKTDPFLAACKSSVEHTYARRKSSDDRCGSESDRTSRGARTSRTQTTQTFARRVSSMTRGTDGAFLTKIRGVYVIASRHRDLATNASMLRHLVVAQIVQKNESSLRLRVDGARDSQHVPWNRLVQTFSQIVQASSSCRSDY